MRVIVFTDLDGTLLDHDSYGFAPAAEALAALKARDIPLILASSKTGAEIAQIHRALGLGDTPAIVENGADILIPGADIPPRDDHARIRSALDDLPADLRRPFRGFGDMGLAEVAQVTGLPLEAARKAMARQFSEPGLWSGSDAMLDAFRAALAERGIHAHHGGRFLTLSLGGTKAGRMREIIARTGAEFTVALGDAPNDIEMLEAADIGVVIRNDHGPGLPMLRGEQLGRIRRSALPGPAGWNAELLEILQDLTEQEG